MIHFVWSFKNTHKQNFIKTVKNRFWENHNFVFSYDLHPNFELPKNLNVTRCPNNKFDLNWS